MRRNAESPAVYRSAVTGEQRRLLDAIRAIILETAHDVREGIAHGMLNYPGVASLGAQKNYVSLYVRPAVLAAHKQAFAGISCGKSCIRFRRLDQLDRSALIRLIRDLTATGEG